MRGFSAFFGCGAISRSTATSWAANEEFARAATAPGAAKYMCGLTDALGVLLARALLSHSAALYVGPVIDDMAGMPVFSGRAEKIRMAC